MTSVASPAASTGAPDSPVSAFVRHHFRHFNAAALVDAADGWRTHLDEGGAMFLTMGGAMSTAELGLSLAEMIRRGKVQAITCTGANLEEDVFNLVAHNHYHRVPNYRDLTPQDEEALLARHLNRVTDTCIPEGEALRRQPVDVGRLHALGARRQQGADGVDAVLVGHDDQHVARSVIAGWGHGV